MRINHLSSQTDVYHRVTHQIMHPTVSMTTLSHSNYAREKHPYEKGNALS